MGGCKLHSFRREAVDVGSRYFTFGIEAFHISVSQVIGQDINHIYMIRLLAVLFRAFRRMAGSQQQAENKISPGGFKAVL
jgi:hypothetical protein